MQIDKSGCLKSVEVSNNSTLEIQNSRNVKIPENSVIHPVILKSRNYEVQRK